MNNIILSDHYDGRTLKAWPKHIMLNCPLGKYVSIELDVMDINIKNE